MTCGRKGCSAEGKWRPVMLFRAPLSETLKRGRDVPIPIRVNVAVCDEHKVFDATEFCDLHTDKGENFERIASVIEDLGYVRPDRKRTTVEWESASQPIDSNFHPA